MQLTDSHRAALADILRWRRDVRHFRPDPVAPATLARLKRAVDLAPSVGNSRPWRFVQVEDARARAAVIASFEACNAEALRAQAPGDRESYASLKLAGLREAPVHLAVFTDHAPEEGRGLGRRTMPETLVHSTAMAIHTLWLAARAENVGLGWVSILDPGTVAAALGTPEGWTLTGYLCLGHPRESAERPLLHDVGWQANTATRWRVV